MASLLRRLRGDETRYSVDDWMAETSKFLNQFGYNGVSYPFGSGSRYLSDGGRELASTLPGYANAVKGSPPAFGAQLVRAAVLSQARFVYRNQPWHPKTPRRIFSSKALSLLENPWPNATTSELVARCEWHAGLAGNAYVTNYTPGRLRVLRPDWVVIVYGSESDPDDPAGAIDGELLGYLYFNGGYAHDKRPVQLMPAQVAHWSPIPDPEAVGVGMSWITPAIRDIEGDRTATEHKLKFFKNGATPQMVVKGIPAQTKEQFDVYVQMMEQSHAGLANAYKTLYLTAGADATVVGSNLQQIDFKATQGSGETRISVLSRVPAPLLGISEGLAGSSLNAGNFGMARRMFADTWVYPALQDLAAALSPLVTVPGDAELWFDTTDIPLLREDALDAAEIISKNASTWRVLVDGGATNESAQAYIQSGDIGQLEHTGLLSVQLQEPGAKPAEPVPARTVKHIVRDERGVAVAIEEEERAG